MIKRLIKVGNSSAVVLDKPTMEHLGLKEGDEVQLTISGTSLVVTGASAAISDEDFDAAFAKFNRNHADLMRRLAK